MLQKSNTTSLSHLYSSIDGLINPNLRNKSVPNWNYMLLKFQIFLLYFYAGVKKMDPEWLGGHSMKNLGTHWVFSPFKYAQKKTNNPLGWMAKEFLIDYWLESKLVLFDFQAIFKSGHNWVLYGAPWWLYTGLDCRLLVTLAKISALGYIFYGIISCYELATLHYR